MIQLLTKIHPATTKSRSMTNTICIRTHDKKFASIVYVLLLIARILNIVGKIFGCDINLHTEIYLDSIMIVLKNERN